ncbi:transforming growth factor-beta-induced protein ig-h3-like [Centruroides sculpturatus]|uniref:transforming growth factor-beta-induced protein ig-h3-like n=1 Tax=Centruroides sculpturatus TaxID=218467 RepID=UPI000C6DE26F|nr:transforming growth factor-beta-induced protein ig-h3-like [Centruroides sculpturatus]
MLRVVVLTLLSASWVSTLDPFGLEERRLERLFREEEENLSPRPWNAAEREVEEDVPFDPSVVIVDKGSSSRPEPVPDDRRNPLDDFLRGFLPEVTSPWWKGPNVCVDRKEIDDGAPKNRSFAFNFQSTSCKETDTSYTCTKKIETNEESKTFVVKRQCCYGYRRRGSECVEFELKELAEVMKDLGASRFVKMLSSVDLLEKLREGNFTVFCPVDDAVTDFEEEDEDNNIPSSRVVRSTDTATVVAGHVVEGYVTSDDFRGNRVLPTLNEKTGIRLNAYSGLARRPFVLPNCAKILGANNYATNGVVHLVDRILPAPTDSVLDIVAKNSQLTVMKGLLSQAGMVEKLSNPEETYTIFAPVDSAFKRMGSELLKKMQKGEGCVTSVVESHISPHVVCSSAVVNVGYVSNLLNGELKLTRDENDKLFVDDVQIVAHDMVGTNGVVHIVEEVLIPDSARTLTETLQRADRSDLVDLIEVAGIREELDTLRNFTFFAPSRNSLKKLLTEESEEFRNNSEKSKELITSHVASTTVKSCDFRNDLILPSLWEDATFRVNRFDVIPGFVHHFTLQCVPILNINLGVCEGAIHVLYQTVSPSKSKIVETLEGRKDLSTFVRLLKESGLAQTLEEDGPFTVLAPDNDAFDNTKDKDVLEDKDKLLDLLKLHILPETLCCSGIRSSAGLSIRRLVTTLNGSEIPVRRSYKGVKFSSSKVVGCDLMAKNGVIHVVNKVVHPSRSHALDFSELVREMFSI